MMELEVPMRKITDYLLASGHPVGRHKARYFRALGFRAEQPEVLAEALKSQARSAAQVLVETTGFGLKWAASGPLQGPAGTGWIMSIWINADSCARPVTAYPGKGG